VSGAVAPPHCPFRRPHADAALQRIRVAARAVRHPLDEFVYFGLLSNACGRAILFADMARNSHDFSRAH
jgi:hypothetical protein